MTEYSLRPVGFIRSQIRERKDAPMQGVEGAPDADLEVVPQLAAALSGLKAGDEVFVLTWLHRADRSVLEVHPRDEYTRPLRGVFDTRSPDRPNPIGLHRVTIRSIEGTSLRVGPIEAIDGTPVLDIKPVLPGDGR